MLAVHGLRLEQQVHQRLVEQRLDRLDGPAVRGLGNGRLGGPVQRDRLLQVVGTHQLNSMMIWSTARDSPLFAEILPTTPSCVANSTFSIFIASITASFSPACTC